MKRRGSVRGRADAGTGSGPGVERVITHDYIAHFVHVYLDNIFIYSSSIEEHEKHLELVFNKLHIAQLYLS